MLEITPHISIPLSEVDLTAVRASGPGGQNVNKVSSAIHLRFNINASSLPEPIKEKLKTIRDRRLTRDGVIVIKAQRFRDQDKNREDALRRLQALIINSLHQQAKRIPTKPSRASMRKRLDGKTKRARTKALRSKVDREE
ncbi:MAG: ribosome-associated protein [Rhodothermales bacterium]|jgi:ribosome-associated protein